MECKVCKDSALKKHLDAIRLKEKLRKRKQRAKK